jgi:lipopolysaccharide transport system permease protein
MPFERAWRFRDLIKAILSRELASRFRGSMFGWIWAIAAPLVMMMAYTVVFSGIVTVSHVGQPQSFGSRALLIFTGMTIFNFVSELLYRGPALLHEHAPFIKKSIFPTETLAWIAVLRALVYSGISFAVLLVFKLALTWNLPWTSVLVPFLVIPLLMLLLGATWFLMALGAFTRDIVHLMATIVPLLMWVTPVFYTFADIPVTIQPWMRLNIMADYVDMLRDIVLFGITPDLQLYGICVVVSSAVFFLGYAFFIQYKSIIVDVI